MGTATTTIDSGTIVNDDLSSSAAIARSKMATEGKYFSQPLESLRIHDSTSNAVLPNTAGTDDLGLILGTFGTSGHSVQTSDAKNTTVTQITEFTYVLPAEYKAGGTITLSPWASMMTTVANGTATIDCVVHKKSKTTFAHGSDICATDPISINAGTTPAARAFTITPTGIVNGDELTVQMTIAITDSATGTAVIGLVTEILWLLQVQG